MDTVELRKAFINRLTEDRKGYCAPFFFFSPIGSEEFKLKNAPLSFSNTTADMIVRAFDEAVKDVCRNTERRRRRSVKRDHELRKNQ